MQTTPEMIREWLEEGKEAGATHVIVVCDTFDYEDYPVHVMPKEDVIKKADEYRGKNMQTVMKVYDLSKDVEDLVPKR